MWCTFVGPILQPGTFPCAWEANSSWCGGNERLVYISQTAANSHFFILTTSKIHLPGFFPNCATILTHISTWNLHTLASKLFPRMTAVHTCRIPPKLALIWHYMILIIERPQAESPLYFLAILKVLKNSWILGTNFEF